MASEKGVRQALEEWRKKERVYLSPAELQACQKNPALAATIRGPDLVACVECGLVLKKLDRHLRGTHRKTATEYKADHAGAEILTQTLREKFTSQVKPFWGKPHKAKPRGGVRGVAIPSEQTIPETVLAELALQGMTFAQMAKELSVDAKQARSKAKLLERLGFPRRGGALGGYEFQQGRLVTGKYIQDLLDDCDLGQRELARDLRIHPVWLGRLLRRRYNLPLRSETARHFVNYRRGLTSKLTVPVQARAAGLKHHGFIKGERRSRFLLRSEMRDIPQDYALLHEMLPSLANVEPGERLQWILKRSRAETAQPGAPMKFRRLLFRWLPIRQWIEQDPDVLMRLKPNETVKDFLAFDYGTSRLSIQECLSGTLQPLDPERAKEKTGAGRLKAGRRQGSSTGDEKKAYFEIGRAVENAVPRFKKLIAEVRALPERVRGKRRLVIEHLRKEGFSDDEAEAGISARDAKIAARWFVANKTGRPFDQVKKYHNTFLSKR